MSNWESESTTGKTETIDIEYTSSSGTRKTASLASTQTSESRTTYMSISYTDGDGKSQEQEVASSREATTRTTQAAVCGNFIKWRFEQGLGLPGGDVLRQSNTSYSYTTTREGPVVAREITEEYITFVELAGSLSIEDFTGVSPSTSLFCSSRTINTYEQRTDGNGRPHSYQKTERYLALGLTQEGSQTARERIKEDLGDGAVTSNVLADMSRLVFDGIETRSSIGRAPTPTRPSAQDREPPNLADPDDDEYPLGDGYNSDDGELDGSNYEPYNADVGFSLDPDPVNPSQGWPFFMNDSNGDGIPDWAQFLPDGQDWEDLDQDSDDDGIPDWAEYVPISSDEDGYTYGNYTMPFASDDYYTVSNGAVTVVSGAAAEEARLYGILQNQLKAGNAYGFNITTGCDYLPTEPFAPVFVQAAGLVAAGRLDGTSWAFDANGLIVSSDVLLCGVSGRTGAVATSWLRLPVPPGNLPVITV